MSWANIHRWSIGTACAVTLFAGCDSGGQTGSETHWYAACDRDSDCSSALRCICGICTMPCTGVASCGSTAPSACIEPESPAVRALCGDDRPLAASVCAATCTATSNCPSGLKCSGGICAVNAAEAGGSSGPGPSGDAREAGAAPAPDGASPIQPEPDASVPSGDGGRRKPRPPVSFDAGDARVVDANGSSTGCDVFAMPAEAVELASDSSLVLFSAPTGVYFATPELVVRRVAPNGTIDTPLGSDPLNLKMAGVGGIFYTTGFDIHWFSPSEGRVVASWANPSSDNVVPIFLGDRMFGIEEERHDGGRAVYSVVDIAPSPDGGRPLVHKLTPMPVALTLQAAAMTADDRMLYYAFNDTVYEVLQSPNAAPRLLAGAGGLVRSLQLSADSLLATWWSEGTPAPGGIFTIDRKTGAQSQLVDVAQVYALRVFGDSVYFSTPGPGDSCRSLRRVPLAGGVPETLAVAEFVSFEFGPTDLYLGTPHGLFKLAQ